MGRVADRRARRRGATAVRRFVDVFAATTGLLVTAPVLLAAAVLVRWRLGSPVLFKQRRLGLGAEPFELLKLRTMRAARADEVGPQFDALRTTRLGRILRASSIDELPSLVNVLRGDLSLVGPRPLPVAYLPRFSPRELRRFDVKPGVTGLAQVSGRNSLAWNERLELDATYVDQRTLRGDIAILWRTVLVVVLRRGVNAAQGVTMTELPHYSDRVVGS